MAPATDLPEVQRRSPVRRKEDRRRHQRVKLVLLGRLMLEDRREFPCQTVDISPGGLAVTTAAVGRVGQRVVAYIEQIGRVEGLIVRQIDGGFAIELKASLRKKDRLAAKLTWLANRHELNLPEDRRHERMAPRAPLGITVSLPDGRQYRATIIDASLSGCAVSVSVKPPIGSPLNLGTLRGTVVRHLDVGIAVEFATEQTPESLRQALGLGLVETR